VTTVELPPVRSRPGPTAGGRISQIVVVVPVHDEQELLEPCLLSIDRARHHRALRHVRTHVVVVLDGCTDDSSAIARRLLGGDDRIISIDSGNVGVARASGADHAVEHLVVDPEATWLAHTDADSEVPRRWLVRHAAAGRRSDALAGVVRVADWSDHPPGTRRAFARSYGTLPVGGHPHVHGANLGVRVSAYLEVGGFPPVACSEDHALWDALRDAGHRRRATRRSWVSTSARSNGRAAGGFADTLVALDRLGSRAARPLSLRGLTLADLEPLP